MNSMIEPMIGRYVHVDIDGEMYRIYFEENGAGVPLVCLHTAGSDGRQWRHLLADEAFGHLDEVTAAELRETFLKLARECGSTAILITHQLEEAISVGDRIVVFGKSAKLLADIHVNRWTKNNHPLLREAIQSTLQNNQADPRLANAQ